MTLLRPLLVVFGQSVLVFLIFFAIPGNDPAARLAGRGAPAETIAAVRAEYGLDQPLPLQYVTVMRRLFVTQDLPSFVNRGQLVVPAVLRAAPITLALAVGAAVLWCAAGLLIGLGGRGRVWDGVVLGAGLVGTSIPVFWLGEIVNLVTQSRYRAWFGWVPPLGVTPVSVGGFLAQMALPCATLAVVYAGVYGRVLRTSIGAAAARPHVRTARAKGLSDGTVLRRHVLPGALGPAVALLGLDLGALLGGGTILVEVVFGLPGLGRLTYTALTTLDLAMVMACTLYAAVLVAVCGAVADAVTAWLAGPVG